jgi:hypothetical protein
MKEVNQAERAREEAANKLDKCRDQLSKKEREVDARALANKQLTKQLNETREQLAEAKRSLEQKEQLLARLSGELAVARARPNSPPPFVVDDNGCPTATAASNNFAIHRHVPAASVHSSGGSGGGFQVVTQSLNVSPAAREGGGSSETERLRRDVRRLREYLTTSVQERRYLLKKIGSLNQQLEKIAGGGQHDGGPNPRALLMHVASLQEKVAAANQDNDVLRSHLEAVADELEASGASRRRSGGSVASTDLVYGIRRAVRESQEAWEARRQRDLAQPTLMAGHDEDSPSGLPDPSLAHELEAELAAESRRGGGRSGNDDSRRARAYSLLRRRQGGNLSAAAAVGGSGRRGGGGSDEEDSWSEPDVYAARRRMGDIVVDSIDGASETETDLEKREFIQHIIDILNNTLLNEVSTICGYKCILGNKYFFSNSMVKEKACASWKYTYYFSSITAPFLLISVLGGFGLSCYLCTLFYLLL